METNKQYKHVPFDLETAKKIQAGKMEGKMYVSDDTHNSVRIICTDRESAFGKIIALEKDKIGVEWVRECNIIGEFLANPLQTDEYATTRSIVLVVPDNEPQFKPFDKVLVRSKGDTNNKWFPAIYAYYDNVVSHITVDHRMYDKEDCIPYEGNEHLVGTTDKPKEK